MYIELYNLISNTHIGNEGTITYDSERIKITPIWTVKLKAMFP